MKPVKTLPHSTRRAVLTLGILVFVLVPFGSHAQRVQKAADVLDGSGLVNYMTRPTFTVGSWVKYHTRGSSEQGFKDDYTVTILVGGEEVWWGEPCFWIETRTKKAGDRERVTASLVSYAAFGDTMAEKHLMWFIRKTINGMKPDGTPDIGLYTRGKNEIQLRRVNWEKDDNGPTSIDSLGAETVTVPAGTFDTRKVVRRYVNAETAELGDSTTYYERRLDRTSYLTPKVPITNLALVDVDDHQKGKTWMAGKFDKGPLNTLERARGRTELIEMGSTGLTALLVPADKRKPIDRKVIEATLAEYATGTPPLPKRPSNR
ncbi:MAG TPA: hypothetical protein VFQ05_12285 [Candidatus Eisenbacteria bacterium]|nr:hypothetical protein [Candidatus Eisenbacteria bacterium]